MIPHIVEIEARPPEAFAPLFGPARMDRFRDGAERARRLLDGHVVWNINSAAAGGGVAEMLNVLLAYVRGFGIDCRWLVVEGDPAFFQVTKRLHNRLHGVSGDGGHLDPAARAAYDATTTANQEAVLDLVMPDDVVILHDPQTAGLAQGLAARGATVVWRSHVGSSTTNQWTDEAWAFLAPYLKHPHAFVFSRPQYVPALLSGALVAVVAPSIDPFSPKNHDLEPAVADAILQATGLVGGHPAAPPSFTRRDGRADRITDRADLIGPVVGPGVPYIVQVSRWDRLKDMAGVLDAFARSIAPRTDAHLVLAGPSVKGVADDPEGEAVLAECVEAWSSLPQAVQERVTLASLSMADNEQNAVVVNALQRRATVVVQKSLVEGFGLTVAEAMWKSRPVVASAIGGIIDQIVDGESGLLVPDPTDLAAFGGAVTRLLEGEVERAAIAAAARQRVFDHFLPDRDLLQYVELFGTLSVAGRRG